MICLLCAARYQREDFHLLHRTDKIMICLLCTARYQRENFHILLHRTDKIMICLLCTADMDGITDFSNLLFFARFSTF